MQELYTVEEIADMIHLHQRTIRKYINDGKISATKIGKQWRISKEELKNFLNNNKEQLHNYSKEEIINFVQSNFELKETYQTCTILDCKVDIKDAVKLSELFITLINEKDPQDGEAKFQYIYDEVKKSSRYILWGNPLFIGKMLTSAGHLLENN